MYTFEINGKKVEVEVHQICFVESRYDEEEAMEVLFSIPDKKMRNLSPEEEEMLREELIQYFFFS